MSEYVTVNAQSTDDPAVLCIITNQQLTEINVVEVYHTPEEGNEGSTIAQTLFHAVDGIRALRIDLHSLTITREPDISWETLVDDVRDVLRDFFL